LTGEVCISILTQAGRERIFRLDQRPRHPAGHPGRVLSGYFRRI